MAAASSTSGDGDVGVRAVAGVAGSGVPFDTISGVVGVAAAGSAAHPIAISQARDNPAQDIKIIAGHSAHRILDLFPQRCLAGIAYIVITIVRGEVDVVFGQSFG